MHDPTLVSDSSCDRSPWDFTDEELLDGWKNIETLLLEKDEWWINSFYQASVNSSNIAFNPDLMSPVQLDTLLMLLERHEHNGLFVTPQEAMQYRAGERTSIVKSREIYGLGSFNLMTSASKAYGYIRFRKPQYLQIEEIMQRSSEHLLSAEDIKTLWPDRVGLYLYEVQEFVLFPKPRLIEPIEGNQLFIQDVELKPVDEVKKSKVRITTKIIKSMTDVKEHIILGEVLIPDEYDGQEHTMTVAEIQKTAHCFMRNCQVVGLMHNAENNALQVVESYTAPCDFQIPGEERIIKRGTWLLATHVGDPDVWAQVESGELTGYSVEGYGVLQAIEEN